MTGRFRAIQAEVTDLWYVLVTDVVIGRTSILYNVCNWSITSLVQLNIINNMVRLHQGEYYRHNENLIVYINDND